MTDAPSSHPDARYRVDGGTTLVNLQDVTTDEWDVYIGRRAPQHDLPQSPHANPFAIGYEPLAAYTNYKPYLFYRYLSDPAYRDRVKSLVGGTLACWCLPDACHGEILLDLLAAEYQSGSDGVREFIAAELLAMDSRELTPRGIDYRARVEEYLEMQTGFAATIEQSSAIDP